MEVLIIPPFMVTIATFLGIGFFLILMGGYWYFDSNKKLNPCNNSLKGKRGVVTQCLETNLFMVRVAGELWKAESKVSLNLGDKVIIASQDTDEMVLTIIKE